jgi:ABC-type glycerol-3-phosphate transport system substrate-binding protein
MRKLRFGAVGLVGLAAASLAGAPTLGQSPAAAPVTISYLTHWGPDQVAVLDSIGKAYTAANPNVTVEIRAVPFQDLLTTLTTQATSPGGPSIAGIYNLWLPDLVKAGVVAPAPEGQLADIGANWPASAIAGASVADTLYGYPNEINTYALNYNKRLFAEAGIDAPPATWDELIADAQALTKKDGDVITQQGLGLINSWAAGVVHPWYSMVASNGGDIVDGTTPTLATGAAADTMALYERLVGELGVTDPSLGTADANTAGPFMDNFANGNTAMIIMANWWKGSLEASMGDAFSDIATAPIPVGPNGEGSHPVSYEWLTVVNAAQSPEVQAAAWDFLQFLHGDDSADVGSGMGGILVSMGIIPSRTSDTTAFAEQLSAPFLQAYIEALPEAVPFPMISGGQELSEMIQRKLEGIMFGEMTAADAAAQAQTEAEAILSAANPAE